MVLTQEVIQEKGGQQKQKKISVQKTRHLLYMQNTALYQFRASPISGNRLHFIWFIICQKGLVTHADFYYISMYDVSYWNSNFTDSNLRLAYHFYGDKIELLHIKCEEK